MSCRSVLAGAGLTKSFQVRQDRSHADGAWPVRSAMAVTGGGRATCIKMEQDGRPVKPIRHGDAMCVHVAVKQRQRALGIMEPQTRKVAQQSTPNQRIVTCGCRADRDSCVRSMRSMFLLVTGSTSKLAMTLSERMREQG